MFRGRGLVPGLLLSRSLSQQQLRLGRRNFRLACSPATACAAALPARAVAFEQGVTCRVQSLPQRSRGTRSRSRDFAVLASVPVHLSPSRCRALSRRRPREAAVRVHWLMRPPPRR